MPETILLKVIPRSVSERGLSLIREFEGLVLHSYLDIAGIPTTGYGTTHYENGKAVTMKDPPITKERAEQLLRYEVQAKSYVLNQTLDKHKILLNQNQYDALSSFAYNVGMGALLGSTLFKKIKANPNDPEIKAEFLRWNKAHKPDGKVFTVDALKKRREKEANLYFF